MALYRVDASGNFVKLKVIKLDGANPIDIPLSETGNVVFSTEAPEDWYDSAPGGEITI